MVWKADGRVERYRVANVADIGIEKARRNGAWFRTERAAGDNPAEARRGRRAEPLLSEVWGAFLAHHHSPSVGRRSIANDKWRWEKHLAHLAGHPGRPTKAVSNRAPRHRQDGRPRGGILRG